jgi:hypothetical protein
MPSLEISGQEILEIRKAMLETVGAGAVKPEKLRKLADVARAVLESEVATLVVKRLDSGLGDAVVIPIKADIALPDGMYIHPWAYTKHYARIYNMPILLNAIATLLLEASRTYKWFEFTVVEVTSKEGREALAKLVIADALVDDALTAARMAERVGILTWGSTTTEDYMRYKCTDMPNPSDAITCMTKRAIRISKALRWKVAGYAEGWLRKLEERVEVHNRLVRRVGRYISEVRMTKCEDEPRCMEYLNNYRSYVEYRDGVVKYTVRSNWDGYKVLALLGGAEETEKFFRARLDILAVRELEEPMPLGSWLIGRDKTTNQPFTISLPPRCVDEEYRKCVEYALGLRNNALERTVKGRVRIVEV